MLIPAVFGALLMAVLSTVADYVWFTGFPPHQWYSGVIHGAALFVGLGGYLGFRKGKFALGALGGVASGMIAAGSFYVLAPLGLGYNAMVVSWVLLWIGLAILQTQLDGQLDVMRGVIRGLITSLVAALGFAVVLYQLYRRWPPETFPAVKHFVAWSMAYLPGLYVLLKRPAN